MGTSTREESASRTEQREMLDYDGGTTEPHLRLGWALRAVLSWGQRTRPLYPHSDQPSVAAAPRKGVHLR